MSKSEILYVKGMNVSESDGEDGDEDIWDDRKLNDAYDKALRIANAEVAKRLAMSTNNQNKNKEGQPANRKDKQPNKGGSSKGNKKNQNGNWKVGMPCRAVYEGDGIEYEAIVMRIVNDKECVVRFLGYDNSEIVLISTLKPSLGKEEQTIQIEQALDDKTDEAYTSQSPNTERMDCVSDRVPSPGSTEQSFHRKKKSGKKKKNQNSKMPNGFEMPEMPFPMPHMSAIRNLGAMDMPLPPPPPLALGARSECEEQAVSSMLLSWYMSGYYTGLYQGLKRAKESRRNV
ncbi:hypothetical protein ABMA27_005382 [Loxostege sticticalis]|uniref:Tudor domain-containing protein n=1 Tax=Loxostege sticticalis TaxID=481309 RepID=A0ABR3HJ93_LOXSC